MSRTRSLLVFVTCLSSAQALNCSALNASAIRLITFDVFAALADLTTSLTDSVEATIPGVSASTASSIVTSWINAYGVYAGNVFGAASTTGGMEPFPFVLRLGLNLSLQANGYASVSPPEFERLATAWGNLTFWSGTSTTLSLLSNACYLLAPLSNGDRPTLVNATKGLLPGAPMHAIFSSDRPVGAFKPATAMYAQLLAVSVGVVRSFHDAGMPHSRMASQNFSVNQVLHVAGATADANGARAYGLLAGQNVRAGTAPSPTACFVIPNITLLPALLNVSASPSQTASGTRSATGSRTRTVTPSATGTLSVTGSPTRATPSPSHTSGVSATQTESPSPSGITGSGTPTLTETPSPGGVTSSETAAVSATPSPTGTTPSSPASQSPSLTAAVTASMSPSGGQPGGTPIDRGGAPSISQGALAGAIIATLVGGVALGAVAAALIVSGRVSLAMLCRSATARRRPVSVKAWNAPTSGISSAHQAPGFVVTELPGALRKAQWGGGTSV